MAGPISTESFTITALATGDLLLVIRTSDGASGSKIITRENFVDSLPALANARLADMAPWSIKMRNNGVAGAPENADIAALAGATPVAGDFVLGFQAAGNIKKFAAADLGTVIGVSADHAAYTYLATAMEPLAQEPLYRGTGTYTVGAGVTKLIQSAWNLNIAAAGGRVDVRNHSKPLPLRDISFAGNHADSLAVIIDPALPSYTNARTSYFDRLNTLMALKPRVMAVTGLSGSGNTAFKFLPGPYGNIITHFTQFNATWFAFYQTAVASAWGMWDELGDVGSTDWMRLGMQPYIPVSKNVASHLLVGQSGGVGTAAGALIYAILPSTWGAVPDASSYLFRDDFMLSALDTATKWTRTQSSAGNIEIDTSFQWCKLIGNNTWGANGARSQTSTARGTGKKFICDVFIGEAADDTKHNTIVGWCNGSAVADSDFSHGLDFTEATSNRRLQVFEDGNSRGAVGTTPGYTEGNIYRVRITLNGNAATYEIQGGPEYATLGGASWTDVTPGVTSSSTTPLTIAMTTKNSLSATPDMVSDMRMIS